MGFTPAHGSPGRPGTGKFSHERACATITATPRAAAAAKDRGLSPDRGATMSKRARKRRSRKGNKANHGRRPNA
ncbi:hypothetical protein GCM10012283_11010 [Phycicoccus endophyticus]|nr:hypothetical protein GCM10012283_11010 [Phycicoccus endophyticus]